MFISTRPSFAAEVSPSIQAFFLGLGGESRKDASYPWGDYYHDQAAPKGGDKLAKQVVKDGLAKLAPIIEAGANALGLKVEQISPTYRPNESNPGVGEQKYVASIGGAKLPTLNLDGYYRALAGLGASPSTGDILITSGKEALLDEVKAQAINTAMSALGSEVPVAGIALAAAQVIKDPNAAFGTAEAALNTSVGLATATTSSLASAAMISATVPVIGVVIGAGLAVKMFLDANKAKKEMEKELGRMKDLGKVISSCAKLAVAEAQKLASEIVVRAIPINRKGDGDRLMAHYKNQLKAYKAKATGLEAFKEQYPRLAAEYNAANSKWKAAVEAIKESKIQAIVATRMAQYRKAWAKNPPSKATFAAEQAARREKVAEKQSRGYAKSVVGSAMLQADQRGELPKKPVSPDGKLDRLKEAAEDVGRQDTIRFLLQAARDMRILRKALAAGPSVVSAQQVAGVAAAIQQAAPPAYVQAVKASTIAAVKSSASSVEALAPAQVPAEEKSSGVGVAAGAAVAIGIVAAVLSAGK